MKNFTIAMCTLAFLTGCPTPPSPNNTKGGSQSQQNPGQPTAGQPPVQGGQNPGQQPPGEPNPGQKSGELVEPPPADGPSNPPATGEKGPDDADAPSPDSEIVEPAEGQNEQDGTTMGVFGELPPDDQSPKQSQSDLESADSVKLSGSISCSGDGCDLPFVLRVTPSFTPDKKNGPLSNEFVQKETGVITSKVFDSTGSFSILAPKSDGKVVLELLLDEDENGVPSIGEKFVIYEGGGGIALSGDRGDIQFNFNPSKIKAPLRGLEKPEAQ